MQIPIHQLSLFIRWNNQLVKIEHIRNRFESHCVHSQRAIKEKKKSILFPFATRHFFDFICNLFCFYFRFVFLLCFDICVFDVFLFCADTFENRPFYPSSSSFMFYSRSSCFTHFFLSNHKYFFDSTNTYSRTYVLFVLCLHAIFSSRFALAFSAEPILMEINFIGCIFYGI